MIYTVTFNPSLDYIVKVPHLTLGCVNRTQSEEVYPGGKGINVSIVLKNLKVESKVLGFKAGFTGEEIQRLITQFGCQCQLLRVSSGLSRINVKIKAQQESEINGQGPDLSQRDLERLFALLDTLEKGDILVLAGSIPAALPKDIYEQILRRLARRGIHSVVDATGDLLVNVLSYRPFFIKPNNHELEEIFGKKLQSVEEIFTCAGKLQKQGARNVLVSMAGEGAALLTEAGEKYYRLPPEGTVVNSVGAGDSMVAGFLAGYLKTKNYETAFHLGLAAGSASAFSPWLATWDEIQRVYSTIK